MSIKGYKDANGNIQKYDINSLDAPFTAEVGQVLVVESVDENGYPNSFSVIDQANGVEITDGEPTKESTVMTVNPNAEEVNICTEEDFNAFKEEIDAKFDALVNGNEVAY